jgi:hypothetical protein
LSPIPTRILRIHIGIGNTVRIGAGPDAGTGSAMVSGAGLDIGTDSDADVDDWRLQSGAAL